MKPIKGIAGVCSVLEPLRTISNSWVKHNSGDDTAGVALWDNSSMPALEFNNRISNREQQTGLELHHISSLSLFLCFNLIVARRQSCKILINCLLRAVNIIICNKQLQIISIRRISNVSVFSRYPYGYC